MEDKDCVSLRHYIDLKVQALDDKFDARLVGVDKATKIAADALEKRLDGMNQFRETLKDQAKDFVTWKELLAVSGVIIAATTLIAYLVR